jgi:hypothetical protein
MVEQIPSEDLVSRFIDSPKKWSIAETKFLDENMFIFQKDAGYEESLIWRRYAAKIEDVHSLGCEIQASKQASGKDWTYVGAVTTGVGSVRALSNSQNDSFYVVHAPQEGQAHAHVGFHMQPSDENKKQRRADLAEVIRLFFATLKLEPHACAKPVEAA